MSCLSEKPKKKNLRRKFLNLFITFTRVLKAQQAVPDYLVNPELREVLDKTATLALWVTSALQVNPEVKDFLGLMVV